MGYGSGLPSFLVNLTWQCSPQVEKLASQLGEDDVALDMGAGGRRISANIKTVDMDDSGDTDYISDVCDVSLPDQSVDMIIATGLIEHLDSVDDFMKECDRLLKVGGTLHIEVPFLQQYHDDPIDVRRYTVPGLKRYMGHYGFESNSSGFHIGPSVTIATLNAYYAAMLFEGSSLPAKVMSNAAFLLTSLIWKPFTYLDWFLKKKKSAHRLAFGSYCTAIKRGQ